MALQVELVSADRTVWTGEATLVVARTVDGEIGIMPNHAPVLAVMNPGDVKIKTTSGETVVANVDGGFLSVDHNRIVLVADHAAMGSREPEPVV